MKNNLNILMTVLLISLTIVSPVQAQTPELPVVHAVMFWMAGCKHCEETISLTLPPIYEKYGQQFDLTLIQIYGVEEIDALYSLAESYGIEKKYVGVPFLVIDDKPLVGSQQVRLQLPGLIEENLAKGGVELSDRSEILPLLALAPASDSPTPVSLSDESVETQVSRNNGFELAMVVMVGMGLALLYAFTRLIYAMYKGASGFSMPTWRAWIIPVLSLVGLLVAIYLSYIEMTLSEAFCGPVGDCNAVQASRYARLFGFLPIGLLGIFGYLAILFTWWAGRQNWKIISSYAPLALFGMALFGTLFSVYLTYLELFVIYAVCIWCVSSAVIMTLIMLAAIPPALQSPFFQETL